MCVRERVSWFSSVRLPHQLNSHILVRTLSHPHTHILSFSLHSQSFCISKTLSLSLTHTLTIHSLLCGCRMTGKREIEGGWEGGNSAEASCLCSSSSSDGGVPGSALPGEPEPHFQKSLRTKSHERTEEEETKKKKKNSSWRGTQKLRAAPTTAIKIIQFHSGAAQLSTLCKSGGRRRRRRQPLRFPGMRVAKITKISLF